MDYAQVFWLALVANLLAGVLKWGVETILAAVHKRRKKI